MLVAFRSYGFETILNPRSCCPYTGKETVTILNNNIKLYTDKENGSYRFVMYKNGRSVSALQVMSKNGVNGMVANVITVKQHRRKGYAKILWNEAKQIFKHIEHSTNLSPDGQIFAQHCN